MDHVAFYAETTLVRYLYISVSRGLPTRLKRRHDTDWDLRILGKAT